MYGRTRLLAAGCCLVVMFLGCTDGTGGGPLQPEFAKGGNKGKPGGGGGGSSTSVVLVGMEVVVLTDGLTHGMTDVSAVDSALAAVRLDDEFFCGLGPDLACTPAEQEVFFGCPDATVPCAKILFTFSGGDAQENIGFNVSHSIQGCAAVEIEVE